MHIEVLIEDSSGAVLLEVLLPKILGPFGKPHTWTMHSYRGIGKLPQNLKKIPDPSKRVLLDQLPRVLAGLGKTPGVDAVLVVIDVDNRDCAALLRELRKIVVQCDPAPNTLFRLAIEEMEAWLLGDHVALMSAYPQAKKKVLNRYVQDSICGTWEVLADALYPGGAPVVKRQGWPLPGQLKHQWVKQIAPHMDPERNLSPSFAKLRDGLRQLAA